MSIKVIRRNENMMCVEMEPFSYDDVTYSDPFKLITSQEVRIALHRKSARTFGEDTEYCFFLIAKPLQELSLPKDFYYELQLLIDGKVVAQSSDWRQPERIVVNDEKRPQVVVRFTMSRKLFDFKDNNGVYEDKNEATKMVEAVMFAKQLDIVTINVGGESINVIKNVIKTKSPVFFAMLEHKMKESSSNVIEIDDSSFEVMSAFFMFVCTNCIRFDDVQQAINIIYVADKYNVTKLVEFASDYLATNLSPDNAIQILTVADRHSLRRLEQETFDFIAHNKKLIAQCDTFEELFTDTSLHKKVTRFLFTCDFS